MNIEEIKVEALNHHVPIVQDGGLQLILDLIQTFQCKNILEFGTAVGYSAIAMAILDKDIIVDTYEIDEQRYQQALMNIASCGLTQQINAFLQDGKDAKLVKKYDLVFVDAAKAQYKKYMEIAKPYLSDKGFYVFDNLNFHGIVDNPNLTHNRNTKSLVKKIKDFRDYLLTDPDLDVIFFKSLADGLAVVKYRKTK